MLVYCSSRPQASAISHRRCGIQDYSLYFAAGKYIAMKECVVVIYNNKNMIRWFYLLTALVIFSHPTIIAAVLL